MVVLGTGPQNEVLDPGEIRHGVAEAPLGPVNAAGFSALFVLDFLATSSQLTELKYFFNPLH
jgi:hypothetical protein